MTTTNLQHLYDAIEGRTKGPWGDFPGDWSNQRFVRDHQAWLVATVPMTENSTFIATMGTCADEILAVLRAAELAAPTIGHTLACYGVSGHKCTCQAYHLSNALAALAAKSGQSTKGGTK